MMDPLVYPPGGVDGARTDNFSWLKKRTVTIDLASVATIVAAEQDVTPTGTDITNDPITADEVVLAFYPAVDIGVAAMVGFARVKSAGVLTVCMVNPTAGNLDAASKTFTLITAKITHR